MSLTALLSAILLAALSVVSVAFGWQPCCCGIVTVCCSGASFPDTFHWTMSAPGCACLDGLSGTLVYGFSSPTNWSCGFTDLCASGGAHSEIGFDVRCDSFTGLMKFGIGEGPIFGSTLGTAISFYVNGGTTPGWTVTTNDCPPAFQIVVQGTLYTQSGFATNPCEGLTYTLTITF